MLQQRLVILPLAVTGMFAAGGANAQALPGAVNANTTAETGAVQLEEVVVTANKVAEDLQKVSYSIATVSQDTLNERGVNTVQDLQRIVPGLQSLGTTGNFSIRGVKSDGSSTLVTPSVAYSQDGVVFGRFQNSANLVYDLDRIEVLKGPQGSLSGTSASGGSISAVSKQPVLSRFEGNGSVEFGNYDTFRTTGALNVPLGNEVAVRAAFGTARHSGYFDNSFNGNATLNRGTADVQGGRLRILFEPTDALQITLGANYQNDRSIPFVRPICFSANTVYNCPFGPYDARSYPLSTAAVPYYNSRTYGYLADVEWNFGFATLTVLPAFNKLTVDSTNVPGYTLTGSGNLLFPDVTNATASATTATAPAVAHIYFKQEGLETRLAHTSDALKWVVGAVSTREDNTQTGVPTANPATGLYSAASGPQNNSTKAAFGQITFSVSSAVRLIAGARYTDDKKFDGFVFCSNSFATPVVITPNIYTAAQCPTSPANLTHLEQKYWTYRGGVEYDLASQSMLYATVSTGIHPGNINNASLATTYPQYVFSQPEKLTNYEIGSKNRFFDDRLQLNGSIFYLDYKNYQATFLPDPNITVSATLNAARAESKGADFDTIYLLSANDRLNFSGQYLDAKFKTFVIPAFGINYSGETLASSPKWVLDAGYQHSFSLASDARLVPRADVHYESAKKVGAFQPFPIDEQGGYATADATVSYESASSWRVVGYVRNLTNKVYFTNVVVSGLVPQVRATANISDPRTYGIRLEGSF